MVIHVAVLKEKALGEKRVAMVPTLIPRLERLGADLNLEADAGLAATFADIAYRGATIENAVKTMVSAADIVLAVQSPSADLIKAMKPGGILISLLYGTSNPDTVLALRDRRVTAFAMEQIPRISRAQSMDVLSSQAALVGYYAPLLGAVHMPRILPMMTTAVGSLRAAKVLVMGLGVAGLSALATAHRLGSITVGYDVRLETREQAESLGAKFIDTGIDARGEGGYARELTTDERAKVEETLTRHIAEADMVITTASVPGRPAPKLISSAQVAAMKPGAVIVDLGAESGGNCEETKPGETVNVGTVTVLGPIHVPSALAQHASELYAKNVLNLLDLIIKDGSIHLDFEDEVIAGTVATHDGKIRSKALHHIIESACLSSPEIA
ncbi:NAD(P) transhydrogenase subunit alpha [Rhizobium sp. P28RR-XV]|uniref:NAD(P) transhydrogenase subunit alpha n=1 Tax=Rhizobium sp. P28RR-XV TaxID=2726737 RepID=UPI0014576C1C|nr:NAD(P) transhydrogenase subunit alpha [Rhizobium sp. P28RR-XV]NLR89479.1 NAD(P) transhydrogenase subunit alpha [Rhizobium sp. P28RR-XV]